MAEKTAVEPRRDRRHARHQATKREILDAAWKMVRDDGVNALSLRALARAVDMEPQSLYTYFASKHSVYDHLFADVEAADKAKDAQPDAKPVDQQGGDVVSDLILHRSQTALAADDGTCEIA